MRVTLTVSDGGGGRAPEEALGELRRWLQRHPELRDRLGRQQPAEPRPGEMGAVSELLPVLLAPGGLTAALGAALVAWLQSRRGNQTVTITLPDATQITVTSENVRGLTEQGSGDLAQQIAATLHQGIRPRTPAEPQADGAPPDGGQRPPAAAADTA
ncbi:hypothetical protein ACIA98_23720 [Streptomyces sp. NPDC051366]|uniref:effector-associated constant component EACC1 n=1 Tax=Streptomyces sp. NPDC051366 TaxID=3365652 RepID=UPI0037B14314